MKIARKWAKQFYRSQYYYFGIVGATGFIIDSGIFTLLHHFFYYPISRFISISIAVLFTWLLNRRFTFKYTHKISHREFVRYATVNLMGALINFSVFLMLCHVSILLRHYFIVSLALATSISMVWNFVLSKFYVFRMESGIRDHSRGGERGDRNQGLTIYRQKTSVSEVATHTNDSAALTMMIIRNVSAMIFNKLDI